jgi:hypothetical protein
VTLPVPVGATVTVPLADCVPLKALPITFEAVAEQEVALADVQASCTPWPKLMLDACLGDVNVTVGFGVDIGVGIIVDIGAL